MPGEVESPNVDPLTRTPLFTDAEIAGVREGINGIKNMFPARFYHDEALYQLETDIILKKNWLCVGRWDWAEKPGDYFTLEMFGEPVLIIRDKTGRLNALINVCQHRWAQVVANGAGNTNLLVCPYHSWTYDLDGQLRGIAVTGIPNFDKKACRMPALRLEEWKGFVFINFDEDAAPLSPQLAGLDEIIGRFGLENYRTAGRLDYDTTWNYKFSFETGYEAYHHEGVHKSILQNTAHFHHPVAFGDIWGVYSGTIPPSDDFPILPFGPPPWMSETEAESYEEPAIFIGIYPSLIMYVSPHQVTYITTEFKSVKANRATTANAIADWAWEHPDADRLVAQQVEMMKYVQDEDSAGCRMLQRGIVSSYNRRSVVHPIESQLSHYYGWMMDQYLNAGAMPGK